MYNIINDISNLFNIACDLCVAVGTTPSGTFASLYLFICKLLILANVKSRSRSLYVVVRSSVCLSVTLVHHTQAIEIFGNVSNHLIRWPSADLQVKFYGECPRGTPPLGELNTRGVAENREVSIND